MELIIFLGPIVVICILIAKYLKVVYECVRKVVVVNEKAGNAEDKKVVQVYKQPPGPMPWPILGNLALLGQFEGPFEGFSQIAKKYGDIYSLTLGTTRCLVVNNLELIREVLNKNGKFFGGRPDLIRYNWLFGGDRNNSLALCDWSQLQQKRRNLARKYCSPRDSTDFFAKMNDVGCLEVDEFMDKLTQVVVPGQDFHLKPLLMQTCANMFIQYMCSTRFDYEDTEFQQIVHYFDEIFWEINQGYAVDFLPWLLPFYLPHMNKLSMWATTIRNFILRQIINKREQTLRTDEPEMDFTDALLKNLANDPNVTKNTIIFMLEDFIGGHSAIGNLVMLALGFIARDPKLGHAIQEEVDQLTDNGKRKVSLYDTDKMPVTVATIYEVLRYASSPIVPHVATEDTCINGYGVTKGTVVFLNNYILNLSEKYWEAPKLFDPNRFIETVYLGERSESSGSDSDTSARFGNASTPDENGYIRRVRKNIPHFLPFSIGKRTCIGQNLVRSFSFLLLANIMQAYDVSSNNLAQISSYSACVALPPDTYTLSLTPRKAGLA